MKKHVIIFGSARSDGNTMSATKQIIKNLENPLLIDLSEHCIAEFDYSHTHDNDDFFKIMDRMIEYDMIIFATPIYWYTMSTPMKRFVDRISDLLTQHKDVGRKLRQKKMAVICSYATHPEGMNGFEQIFINTANYLGMAYLGCYFHYSGDLLKPLENNQGQQAKFLNLIR